MAPSEYARWSDQDQALAEAQIARDASLNAHGIPMDQARDESLGWDVEFVTDYTVEAVEREIKHRYGKDGLPAGVTPVVTVNRKSLDRAQATANRDPAE